MKSKIDVSKSNVFLGILAIVALLIISISLFVTFLIEDSIGKQNAYSIGFSLTFVLSIIFGVGLVYLFGNKSE